jgi:hypothetical protein
MVSTALTATVEVAEAISNGIRGPVQKIAFIAGQARRFAEGLLAGFKSYAGR